MLRVSAIKSAKMGVNAAERIPRKLSKYLNLFRAVWPQKNKKLRKKCTSKAHFTKK